MVMRRQQRLCIVSRGRANLFGYLTAALVPTDGLEFVVDRRGARRDTPSSGERSGDPRWTGSERRSVFAESELVARGWVLLTRDEASERWVHDPRGHMPVSPKRGRASRRRREWRAFIYVGGAAAAVALAALVGLAVVGGVRLPSALALGSLPAQLINIVR
jgi:hypothetical protein